jgi:hypothetical protein
LIDAHVWLRQILPVALGDLEDRQTLPWPFSLSRPGLLQIRRNAIIAATVVLNIAHIANGFRLLEAK